MKGYVCKCDIKLSAIKYQPLDQILFRISKSPLKAMSASVQIESSDIFSRYQTQSLAMQLEQSNDNNLLVFGMELICGFATDK